MGAVKVDVPRVVQCEEHTCGAAALLAICRHYGLGPDDEATIVRDMELPKGGADPVHLVRAIRAYGLSYEEHRGMTPDVLRATLDAARPVMLALQAWGEGHWVVAIGYDKRGVHVEDPWLPGDVRGFFGWRALANRWHDVEGHPPRPLVHYGLAVWASPRRSTSARRAGRRSARSSTRTRSR
jgi:ABC-type bacteriocin/lantibiotic exporter with double-glycine peptidase domain